MTIGDLAYHQFSVTQKNYSYTSNTAASVRTQESSVEQVTKAGGRNQISRSNSDSLQFLNQYKSKMDGLASAADKIRALSQNSVWSDLKISSSNEGIISDAEAYGKVPQREQYDIDVAQLAQRQNSSISAPAAGFQDGTFSIQTTNGENETVDTSISIDTQGGTASEQDIMEDIVSQINENPDLGVKAALIENEDGSSSIHMESTESGEDNSFTVSGIESTTTKEAKNLVYTVNGEHRESSGNHNVQIDPSGANKNLRLNFDDVGTATVKADVDTEKLAKYTEKLVDAYNEAVDFLVDNAHRGSGAAKALDRLLQSPISKDAMSSIGLDFGRDGKITFEADEFEAAMERDTRMVYDILADNYSVADTIYQKADKASTYSSASLLDNSQMQGSHGGTIVINNYINYSPCYNPFGFMGFPYPGLFFSTRA